MGYMMAMGNCFGCGRVFAFNPILVPSIRVNSQRQPDANGTAEPVCRDCIERANVKRAALGNPPIVIQPGAYAPTEEGAL